MLAGVDIRLRTCTLTPWITNWEPSSRLVLACTRRYRLPETTRWAHRLASGPGRGSGLS